MSTVNKESVRGEIDRLKAEFETLSSEDKISKESRFLIKGLFTIIELMLCIFLERKTRKNNKNSSIPSSQTGKDESSATGTGSKGKGKLESNATASNSRVKESVTISEANQCGVCGKDLTSTPCHHHERRTKYDIVFEKVIEHVDAEVKLCPTCDSTVKGQFPADMPGPTQYGNGIKAYIINLLICQMVALNRVQKLVKTMVGVVISETTMLKFILRLHQALEQWESAAIEAILKNPSMHVDETSLRVSKKNHWIHVYSSDDITLKFLHRKRGKEAIERINIIPRYGGVIVHDCWSSYLTYDHCGHGLCGSHLVRELVHVIESNEYAWAANMKRLLLETCRVVSSRKSKRLTRKEYANLQKRYRNILTRGQKELPVIPKKPSGQRGRMAKSDAHNLWERLREHEVSVLLFAKKSEVAFTNNRAERDLRMAKVKQKVSGCFRTELYAQAYCRISSYLQTMASKGYNPLVAIQMALVGEIK